MSSVTRQETGTAVSRPLHWMDRMFDEWMRMLPARRPTWGGWEFPGDDLIRVNEYRDGNTQVIRAELPGIDPDKDIDVTVSDGMVRIDAERRVEQETQDKGYTRHELHYGRVTRSLPLSDGATAEDVAARYTDGILEIRIPIVAPAAAPEPKKITVSKA